jgi:hydroxymethylbilane synthase
MSGVRDYLPASRVRKSKGADFLSFGIAPSTGSGQVPRRRMRQDDTLRLGTRGSRLALAQTGTVARALRAANPGLEVEIVEIRTTGDRITTTPLSEIGTRGVFTHELEGALAASEIDAAVHSLKDLPTETTGAMTIGAVAGRVDPRDAFVSHAGATGGSPVLAEIEPGGLIGTESPRRAAQVLAMRPDVEIGGIRGNIDTRVRKVKEGTYAGAVLAMAGLVRAGLAGEVAEVFEPERMMPAPGQGALAVECRADDGLTLGRLEPLDDPAARAATDAERRVLELFGGGCHLPLGALGIVREGTLALDALLVGSKGKACARASASGPAKDWERVADEVFGRLRSEGAEDILRELGLPERGGR